MIKRLIYAIGMKYGIIVFIYRTKWKWLLFAGLMVFSFLVAWFIRPVTADELFTPVVTEKITYMIANDYDRTSPISPFELAKWEIETAAFEEEMPAVMQVVMRNPDPEGSPLFPRLIVRVMWHSEFGLVGLVMAYDYVIGDTRYAYVLDDEGYRFERVKPVEPGHNPRPLPEGEGEIRKG